MAPDKDTAVNFPREWLRHEFFFSPRKFIGYKKHLSAPYNVLSSGERMHLTLLFVDMKNIFILIWIYFVVCTCLYEVYGLLSVRNIDY